VHHAEEFAAFVAAIQKLGFRVGVVLYLRNQIDYAQSLYDTLIYQNYTQPFAAFCEEILATGLIRYREWIFPFRYDQFIGRIANVPGVELIVRSYDHPEAGSPVADFLSTLGLGELRPNLQELPHENQRRTFAATVRRYLTNQIGELPEQIESLDVTTLLGGPQVRPTMSAAHRVRFVQSFADSNRAICAKFGLPTFARMHNVPPASAAGLALDDVFVPDLPALLRARSFHAPRSSD
jgi:hypothetical protein